ncbi:MAG: hypothetical protein ACRCZS_06690 [Chroococcidiopsis sp.]
MQPIQKLQKQSQVARSHASTLKSDRALTIENLSSFSATLIDYNADLGWFVCRLDNGSTIYAKSISSVGSKGIGDVVSLYKPAQGMPVIRYL